MGEGRTVKPPPNQRLTVAQAAAALGITEGAVRSRIKRGTLPTAKEGGTVFVLLGDGASEANQTTNTGALTDQSELVEALRAEISHLRRESERKDTIIMSLSQANAEQARTIRAIEAPLPKSESPGEWSIDEEVAREDEGMHGRPGVSEEQKDYERYVRPYEEPAGSPSEAPVEDAPSESGAVAPGAEPHSATEGPREGAPGPSEAERPWWRRLFGQRS